MRMRLGALGQGGVAVPAVGGGAPMEQFLCAYFLPSDYPGCSDVLGTSSGSSGSSGGLGLSGSTILVLAAVAATAIVIALIKP